MKTVGHSVILVPSLWRVLPIIPSSSTDMPSLITVALNKEKAFLGKKTVHTKSPSSSPPLSLDITSALSDYLSFPPSFTHLSSKAFTQLLINSFVNRLLLSWQTIDITVKDCSGINPHNAPLHPHDAWTTNTLSIQSPSHRTIRNTTLQRPRIYHWTPFPTPTLLHRMTHMRERLDRNRNPANQRQVSPSRLIHSLTLNNHIPNPAKRHVDRSSSKRRCCNRFQFRHVYSSSSPHTPSLRMTSWEPHSWQ